jgi:4-hydroxybenzoate polyprenyltransferase
MLAIIILEAIGYVYSLEPFRMKKRPIGDIMCNALLGVFFFLAGMTIGNAYVNPLLIITVFLIASNFYIPTVMTDYEFDKKGGLRTSAVVYGGKRLILGMYLLTAAISIFGVALILSASFEVQIIAVIMIMYTLVFTIVTRNRLWGNQLMLHKNWILIPFGCLTFVFFCLGLFKIVA